MKLSQMTSDQAADILLRISEPVERIAGSPDALALFENLQGEEGSAAAVGIRLVLRGIPVLLKTHREDTYTIIAAMSGKTAEQVAGQNILVTMADCRDFVDRELIDFFRSFAAPTGKNVTG